MVTSLLRWSHIAGPAAGSLQDPGGPEEDERGRFERGGWAHFDDEASTVMDQIYQRAEVFLFGRPTYEVFAGSCGTTE